MIRACSPCAARSCCARADVVVYDRLASPALLELAPAGAELVDVGKAPGRRRDDAGRRSTRCSSSAGAPGPTVVRLKGGDPFVFGRGGEEAEALHRRGRAVRGRARHHERDRGRRVRRHPGDAPRRVDARHRRDRSRGPGEGPHRHRLGRARPGGRHARGPHGRGPRRRDREGADRGRPRPPTRRSPRCGGAPAPEQRTVRATLGDDRRRRRRGAERDRRRRRRRRSTSRWFERRPLFGRTVVVTRAREQASELRARLEPLGAEVIELPAIAIEPVDFALPRPRPTTRGSSSRRPTASTRSSTAASRRAGLDARAARAACASPRSVRAPRRALARARDPRRSRARAVRRRVAARRRSPTRRRPARVCCIARAEQAARRAARRARRHAATRSTCSPSTARYRRRPTPDDARAGARRRGRRDHVHVVVDGRQLLRRGRRAAGSAAARSSRSVRSRRETARARGLRVDAEADPHTIDGLVDGRARRAGVRADGHVAYRAVTVPRAPAAPAAAHARAAPARRRAPGPRRRPRRAAVREGGHRRARAGRRRCRASCSTRRRASARRCARSPISACPAVMLFGVPAHKDARGSRADAPDGVVQVALRNLRDEVGDALVLMADDCLDEYTDHGHCGLLDRRTARSTTTRRSSATRRIAVAQADAGADVIAPSGMMDGQVGAIRAALDETRPRRHARSSPTRRSTRRRSTDRSATRPSARRSSAIGAATRWTRRTRARRSPRSRSTSTRAPTW